MRVSVNPKWDREKISPEKVGLWRVERAVDEVWPWQVERADVWQWQVERAVDVSKEQNNIIFV